MRPNLVLIQGTTAVRYVNGKKDQVVNVDYSVGIRNVKADIEFFREHGVGKDDEDSAA